MNALLYHFFDHPELLDEHKRNLGFSDYMMPAEKQILRFPTHYRLVASHPHEGLFDVHTLLEQIFAQTNSVNNAWFENYAGSVHDNPDQGSKPRRGICRVHRSTSCGDVVFVPSLDGGGNDGEGKYYYCAAAGWTEIDRPLYPVDIDEFKYGSGDEQIDVSVSQIAPDTFDLFDGNGECLNEGNPIYGRRPTKDEVQEFAERA